MLLAINGYPSLAFSSTMTIVKLENTEMETSTGNISFTLGTIDDGDRRCSHPKVAEDQSFVQTTLRPDLQWLGYYLTSGKVR